MSYVINLEIYSLSSELARANSKRFALLANCALATADYEPMAVEAEYYPGVLVKI